MSQVGGYDSEYIIRLSMTKLVNSELFSCWNMPKAETSECGIIHRIFRPLIIKGWLLICEGKYQYVTLRLVLHKTPAGKCLCAATKIVMRIQGEDAWNFLKHICRRALPDVRAHTPKTHAQDTHTPDPQARTH